MWLYTVLSAGRELKSILGYQSEEGPAGALTSLPDLSCGQAVLDAWTLPHTERKHFFRRVCENTQQTKCHVLAGLVVPHT